MDSIESNFERHVFYHGTSHPSLAGILREGFRPPGGGYGFLDSGTYITCDWKTAHSFGPVILRVELVRGTRIVDVSTAPDPAVLGYLRREFGAGILSGGSPHKLIPRNKHLTQRELIELTRHHYRRAFVATNRRGNWNRATEASRAALSSYFRSLLIRYGFHGYGSPDSTIGIVIFAHERVVPKEVVSNIPGRFWIRDDVLERFATLRELNAFVARLNRPPRPTYPRAIVVDLERVLISDVESRIPRPGLRRFLQFCRSRFEELVLYVPPVPSETLHAATESLISSGRAPAWFNRVRIFVRDPSAGHLLGTNYDPSEIVLVDDGVPLFDGSYAAHRFVVRAFEPPYPNDDSELRRLQRLLQAHLMRPAPVADGAA